MSGRERERKRQVKLFSAMVFLIVLLDQVSKYFMQKFLHLGESFTVIKGFLSLTLVHNTGVAFGLFKSYPGLFAAISVIAVIILIFILYTRRKHLSFAEKTALSFMLAGTFGNLTDRLRYGYVIDFIDFGVWPVFNVADSFITIGVSVLVIHMIRVMVSQKQKSSDA